MSKEKTIPDPPDHIKRWIDEQWEQNEDYNQGSRPTYSFRQGASVMYQKDQEELEEHTVGFLDWINEKEIVQSGSCWYEPPMYVHEGEHGICIATSTTELYKKYLESLNK